MFSFARSKQSSVFKPFLCAFAQINTMIVSNLLFSFARKRQTSVLSINTRILSISRQHNIIIFSTKNICIWNPYFLKIPFNRRSSETIMKGLSKISARIWLNLTFFNRKGMFSEICAMRHYVIPKNYKTYFCIQCCNFPRVFWCLKQQLFSNSLELLCLGVRIRVW